MSKSKARFQYAQGDITDANYLYSTLVGDCGTVSSVPKQEGGYYLLSELGDGRSIVIACPTFPNPLTSTGYMRDLGDSDMITAMEEMYVNGMGPKMDFTDHAYIRVLGPNGKAEPVVFRDYADAVAYTEMV